MKCSTGSLSLDSIASDDANADCKSAPSVVTLELIRFELSALCSSVTDIASAQKDLQDSREHLSSLTQALDVAMDQLEYNIRTKREVDARMIQVVSTVLESHVARKTKRAKTEE